MTVYLIVSLSLCGLYAVLMFLYRIGFGKVRQEVDPVPAAESPQQLPFFSIIIPARNEAAHIAACLQSILDSPYPKDRYELILIDDFSTDDTAAIATALLQPPNRVLHLQDYLSPEQRINAYKKKALEIAISTAQGAYIITTDADCMLPPGWLQAYADALQRTQAQFIAAPVSFTPAAPRKTALYYFQSLDFMTMQGITAASNRLRLGNMCNGANMLFSKAAYDAVEGYKGIDHKASGDDMMLMQKIQSRFPDSIHYLLDPAAIVQTPVQPDWRSFINQRIRWASKADSYPQRKMTLILLLVYLVNLNLLIAALIAIGSPSLALYGLIPGLALKVAAELYFLYPVARFYHKKSELVFFIFLQGLHILYIVVAGFLGKFGTYSWKGRVVQ